MVKIKKNLFWYVIDHSTEIDYFFIFVFYLKHGHTSHALTENEKHLGHFGLKALTAIVSQNFWWPTNRRHYIRLYLKLPIPRFNNIIPCASGRY